MRCGCQTRFNHSALSRAPGFHLASPPAGLSGGPLGWGPTARALDQDSGDAGEGWTPGIKASCTEVAWTGLALPAAPTPSLWVDPAAPRPPRWGTGFVPSCFSVGDSERLAPCPMKGGQGFPIQPQVWRGWAPQSPWCSRTGRRELGAGERGRAYSPHAGGSRPPARAHISRPPERSIGGIWALALAGG